MAANPAHVIAEVAIEKIGDVVNDPIAIGERKLKRTRSSALNCTYANGIAILVILRAEWSAPRHKHAHMWGTHTGESGESRAEDRRVA